MTQQNDGGPAFPHTARVVKTVSTEFGDQSITEPITEGGMSLRDWLAGQALIGLLAGGQGTHTDSLATEPYRIADEMLKEREK